MFLNKITTTGEMFAEAFLGEENGLTLAAEMAEKEYETLVKATVMAEATVLRAGGTLEKLDEEFVEKAKDLGRRIWETIKTFFAKITEWVQSVFMSHKGFVDKYKTEILRGAGAYTTDKGFEGITADKIGMLSKSVDLSKVKDEIDKADGSVGETSKEIKRMRESLEATKKSVKKLSDAEFKATVKASVDVLSQSEIPAVKSMTDMKPVLENLLKATDSEADPDKQLATRRKVFALMKVADIFKSELSFRVNHAYRACKKALSLSHPGAIKTEGVDFSDLEGDLL